MKYLSLLVLFFAAILASIAGWITHVVVCIQNEAWFLLFAGAIAFPIGIVHGIGCWFGLWN